MRESVCSLSLRADFILLPVFSLRQILSIPLFHLRFFCWQNPLEEVRIVTFDGRAGTQRILDFTAVCARALLLRLLAFIFIFLTFFARFDNPLFVVLASRGFRC